LGIRLPDGGGATGGRQYGSSRDWLHGKILFSGNVIVIAVRMQNQGT
jgi:hypothetical protein